MEIASDYLKMVMYLQQEYDQNKQVISEKNNIPKNIKIKKKKITNTYKCSKYSRIPTPASYQIQNLNQFNPQTIEKNHNYYSYKIPYQFVQSINCRKNLVGFENSKFNQNPGPGQYNIK